MSPSSTGDSPPSVRESLARQFPLPARDSLTIEVSNATIPGGRNHGRNFRRQSPSDFRLQRAPSSTREGLPSAAQKARNHSQITAENIFQSQQSDEGSNPLKRRNTSTETGADYPRRRATIAVCP